MSDLLPFVLHPGWVISRYDGQRHYVDSFAMRRLYRVGRDRGEVIHEISGPGRPEPRWAHNAIRLRPREDGQYAVGRAEAVIAHVQARSAVLAADIAKLEARYPTRRKRTHVMVDLETLGTTPGSALLSIGAVAFDPVAGTMGERFYVVIDRGSSALFGLREDPATVAWWAKQSAGAREVFEDPGRVPLYVALDRFSSWWRKVGGIEFWAHGPGFDEALLSAAYRATQRQAPWQFWNARCTRTVYAAAKVGPERSKGTHHNALDDAVSQALAVVKAYQALGLSLPLSKVAQLAAAFGRLVRWWRA